MTVRTGYVRFESLDLDKFSEALLGDGPATPTSGYGGWEIKPRPRRRGLTEWTGIEPMQIDIAVLFDNFANNGTVEGQVRNLEQLAGFAYAGHYGEPPIITVDSGGVVPYDVHDKPSWTWVISNIQWGDVERRDDGIRTRQAGVVTILEYIEDDSIHNESAAQKHKGKKKSKHKRGKQLRGAKNKHYVVRPGDTLSKIAARKLGSAKRWHEIARLNGIRDGSKLTVNQTLRLP